MADHTTASLVEGLQGLYDHAVAIKQEAIDIRANLERRIVLIADALMRYHRELIVLAAQHPHLFTTPIAHMEAGITPDHQAVFQYGPVSIAFRINDIEGDEGIEYAGPTALRKGPPYTWFADEQDPEKLYEAVRKVVNENLVKGTAYDPKKV